jgi:hypothetical protein
MFGVSTLASCTITGALTVTSYRPGVGVAIHTCSVVSRSLATPPDALTLPASRPLLPHHCVPPTSCLTPRSTLLMRVIAADGIAAGSA